MFGRYARAALFALVAVLIAGIITWVMPEFLDIMLAGAATEDDMLIRSFRAIEENSLFIMLGAILLGLLAGAVTESGGYYG